MKAWLIVALIALAAPQAAALTYAVSETGFPTQPIPDGTTYELTPIITLTCEVPSDLTPSTPTVTWKFSGSIYTDENPGPIELNKPDCITQNSAETPLTLPIKLSGDATPLTPNTLDLEFSAKSEPYQQFPATNRITIGGIQRAFNGTISIDHPMRLEPNGTWSLPIKNEGNYRIEIKGAPGNDVWPQYWNPTIHPGETKTLHFGGNLQGKQEAQFVAHMYRNPNATGPIATAQLDHIDHNTPGPTAPLTAITLIGLAMTLRRRSTRKTPDTFIQPNQ